MFYVDLEFLIGGYKGKQTEGVLAKTSLAKVPKLAPCNLNFFEQENS